MMLPYCLRKCYLTTTPCLKIQAKNEVVFQKYRLGFYVAVHHPNIIRVHGVVAAMAISRRESE
jgi:hypothetical protein